MNVQAALDSGMSPMIMDGDYNTVPPSNVSNIRARGANTRGTKKYLKLFSDFISVSAIKIPLSQTACHQSHKQPAGGSVV